MAEVVVEVFLKPGVADPEGDATFKALRLLGFGGVTGVNSAKLFRLRLSESDTAKATAEAEEMCRKLLANPVIHDYRITVRP
ncbi:MAG: phosphoribosylformylglycinamidine synthase subunit PurS [Methanobacteriota archaeon]|nr:MAG: phosphoribosylformylglycinamidine synthase subunit PurS [Euryarchaeota archaeon]